LLQNALSLRKSGTGGVSRYEKRRRLLVVASLDDSVETGVAILVDFTALRVVRVAFGAEAKRFGRQVLGMSPNTRADVITRESQRRARLVSSAKRNVRVRMFRVEVVCCDP